MAYSNLSDLQVLVGDRELKQLTDPLADSIDTAIIDQAILISDSRIDGILRSAGYTIPINITLAPIITEISRDIALYNLYGTRISEESSAYLRYKNSLNLLHQIGTGAIVLNTGDAATQGNSVSVIGKELVYTDDYLSKIF